jgi:hypothetical protein
MPILTAFLSSAWSWNSWKIIEEYQEPTTEKRYKALRIIATVYKASGVTVLIVTLLALLAICGASLTEGALLREWGRGAGMPMMGRTIGGLLVVAAVLAILYGGGLSVTLYGVGEAIYLLIALEENTRATVQLLQRQIGSSQ